MKKNDIKTTSWVKFKDIFCCSAGQMKKSYLLLVRSKELPNGITVVDHRNR